MKEDYGIELNLDLSKLSKQITKAKSMAKDVEKTFRDIKVTGLDDVKEIKFDTSKVEEVKKNLEEVASVKDRIANGSIKISGLEDLPGSLSEAEYEAQKLRFEMEKQKKIKMDTSGISEFRQKTEEEMNKVSYTIRDRLDAMLDVAKQKFHQIPSEVSNMARDINKSFSNIDLKKKLVPDLKQIQAGFKKAKQESDGFGKNVSKIVGKGITSLKRFALSLFGIQSAYRAVSKAVHSYLAYDQELSKSIQNTWVGLGSFVAPLLEYLVGAFQKVLAYANALIQALTGINFVARANAKALNQAGKSAGATAKAMKQLGSFDELNNINTDTGSGGAGGGADVNQIELPDIDTSKLQPILDIFEQIQYWASELFAPIKLAWDNVGAELITSVTDTFNKIKELGSTIFSSLFEVWTNGTGQQIVENGLSLWTTFFEIIGNVINAITEAWNKNNNGTEILQTIANIVQDIQKFALSVSDTLKKWTASKEFQSALDFIFQLVRDITGWIEKIAKWVLDMWDKYVKPVLDEKVIPLVGALIELLKTIWDNVLKPLVEKVSNFLKPIIESVIKMVMDRVGNIMDILKSVAQFLTGVFSGDWKKAFEGIKNIVLNVLRTIGDTFTNVFNTIWSVIKGVLNLIIGGFEKMVNGAIKGLNKLISPLTKVGNKVLSVVGIKNFSFSAIPNVSLPRLKVGTDEVLKEGIAYLHAGEKVVPADVVKGGYSGSDNEETNNLLRQLISLIDEKDFEPYIRTEDIGKASVNYINNRKRITGEAIV